jgi:hypothetical protein
VLLVRRDSDDVARSNFLDSATPLLDAARAGRDDQDLTSRMCVPRRAGTGLERDGPATGECGGERLEQHLDANVTREILRRRRPYGARAGARDDDRLSFHRRRGEQSHHRKRCREADHVCVPH